MGSGTACVEVHLFADQLVSDSFGVILVRHNDCRWNPHDVGPNCERGEVEG